MTTMMMMIIIIIIIITYSCPDTVRDASDWLRSQ